MNLVPFESWPDVLAYAKTGAPLFYQAPLDRYATQLYAGKNPPGYEVRARSIRIYPPGSAGRGRNRTSDPFTADAGHLERFSHPIENELPGRGGMIEHHRKAQKLFFQTRTQLEKQDAFTVSGMDAQITILTDAIRQMRLYAAHNVAGAPEWLHSLEESLDRAKARRDSLKKHYEGEARGGASERRGPHSSRRVAADDAPEEIGTIGDVNFAEHGGGLVFRRPQRQEDIYGDCFLEYVEPPSDDLDFDDPSARWTVYSVELDPKVPSWGNIEEVVRSYDELTSKELKADFGSTDPMRRALAYETWAGHYGWHEFDQYASQLTCAEMNARYEADLDCGEDDEEEEEETE